MVFSSITFLCVFLPIVVVLYNLIKDLKIKNILLIIASLIFYAYGEPIYVLLMILCSFINYFMAIQIEKSRALANTENLNGKNNNGGNIYSNDGNELTGLHKMASRPKTMLVLTLILDIGILCVFKYLGFLAATLSLVPGVSFADPGIALPIGISFYTFQALSYVVDVYNKKVSADKNFLNILLYISFFPQLIAGPIVKYHDIDSEIKNRSVSYDDMADGLKRFSFGLAKKVLIANTMGQAVDYVYGLSNDKLCAYTAWVAAIAYMLQIYFDFSGYSDMAIGLGRMFGFHFKENFDYPYAETSIQGFWRKWHISLTNWFREYVYIPLGGNRKGKSRTVFNRLCVFFLTGLWHGANWTFVLWGLYHGLFLMFETMYPNFVKKLGKLSRIYTLLVVCIGFVIFRSDNISQAFTMIGLMFTGFSVSAVQAVVLHSLFSVLFVVVVILAVIAAAGVVKFSGKSSYYVAAALLVLSVISLAGSTYNPFIYFRF